MKANQLSFWFCCDKVLVLENWEKMKFFIVFALIATAYAAPSQNHQAQSQAADTPDVQNFLVRVDPGVLDGAGGHAAAPPPWVEWVLLQFGQENIYFLFVRPPPPPPQVFRLEQVAAPAAP